MMKALRRMSSSVLDETESNEVGVKDKNLARSLGCIKQETVLDDDVYVSGQDGCKVKGGGTADC